MIRSTLPQRLFVVAAHPDDDVIGCGGLIACVAAAGGAVVVAYLSDGSRSHPGSTRYPPAAVAAMREAEARAALRILGVRETPLFFAAVDGTLGDLEPAPRNALVERLANAIATFTPDLVLAPWRRDPHPDHVAAAALTSDALARLGSAARFGGYEVWVRIRGTPEEHPQPHEATAHELPLGPETLERKRRALLAHRSQTTALIDDAPAGFRIGDTLLERWLVPIERILFT
jgi:LmbE family N-acetylglucosaminyl deacetylase